MEDVTFDIQKTLDVIDRKNDSRYYGNIYMRSNETLESVIKKSYAYDKDVLTVLGSGDQALHFYREGAKSVDLFDINKLTIYYFYLRLWVIEVLDYYYPPYNISKQFLEKLLPFIKPKTEEESKALKYWELFKDKIGNSYNLFHKDCNYRNELFYLDMLRDAVKERKFNFYNVDIATQELNNDKKYDIIYTSNIAEYIFKSEEEFRLYKENLDKLLKDDGYIIFTTMRQQCPSMEEFSAFLDDFNVSVLREKYKNGILDKAYVYSKKRGCNNE